MSKRNTVKEEHPSYGMLRFARVSRSGGTKLFGSSIQHNNTIELTISEGSVERSLNSDFYMGHKQKIVVEMSETQFAEAITSFNIGSGVPVTITYTEKDGMIESCPFASKREQFENEFNENVDEANQEVNELISTLEQLFSDKKSLTKKDKEEILSSLGRIRRDINSSQKFLYSQFNEQMNKTVSEAKGEVDAFVQSKINTIAAIAISEQQKQFTGIESPISIE